MSEEAGYQLVASQKRNEEKRNTFNILVFLA